MKIILINETSRKVLTQGVDVAINAAKHAITGPLYSMLLPEGISCKAAEVLGMAIAFPELSMAGSMADDIMIVHAKDADSTISARVDSGLSVLVTTGSKEAREVYCNAHPSNNGICEKHYADVNGVLIPAAAESYRLTLLPVRNKTVFEKARQEWAHA